LIYLALVVAIKPSAIIANTAEQTMFRKTKASNWQLEEAREGNGFINNLCGNSLDFRDDQAYFHGNYRAHGVSVRCIKG
jgi:hypothetical protein